MIKKIIIGYQGDENSNNHLAAKYFADTTRFQGFDVELKPMITGANVIAGLKKGEIDYGVYAYSTDLAGLVQENVEATRGVELEYIDRYSVNLHHWLYKKNSIIKNNEITAIAAHPEAFRECRQHMDIMFPNAEYILSQDSASAACNLKKGKLSDTTAVICHEKAGQQYGLTLIQENVEDLKENGTKFVLVQNK